jgi:Protein of unknown function (DUF4012)
VARAGERPRLGPRGRRILLGLGLVAGLWLLVTVVMLFQARRSIDAGVQRLEEARELLSPGDLVRGEGREAIRAARRDFERARDLAGSPLLAPLEAVPVLGQQVRSVDAQTAAAADIVRIGEAAVTDAEREFHVRPATGPERVALLEEVGRIAARAEQRLRSVDLGPDFFLVGPVGDARAEFADKLQEVRASLADSQAAAAGLTKFLRGPGRYLVLAANNAEMRAGSGMWLSAGVLTVEGGGFELGEMRPTGDLLVPVGAVPVAGDLAARWGFLDPTHDFRNLAATPRFDATAPLAADMWAALTGETVQGVLVLDPLTLRALLAAQGPIDAAGRTLDADNVLQYVFLEQYREASLADPTQQARRDRLGEIAGVAVDAFEDRAWEPADLADELTPAGRGRHVLAWSRDPVEQRGWEAAGLAGGLRPDSLLVSLMNIGGNKLDQFVTIDGVVAVRHRGGGREVTVRLRIANDASVDEPSYVIGPFPGTDLAPGEYLGILAVDVPGAAREAGIDGADLAAAGADGPARVVATVVRIAAGERRAVTVRFRVPGGTGGLRVEPSAREPGIRWRFGSVEWLDEGAKRLEW